MSTKTRDRRHSQAQRDPHSYALAQQNKNTRKSRRTNTDSPILEDLNRSEKFGPKRAALARELLSSEQPHKGCVTSCRSMLVSASQIPIPNTPFSLFMAGTVIVLGITPSCLLS